MALLVHSSKPSSFRIKNPIVELKSRLMPSLSCTKAGKLFSLVIILIKVL